ncbi:MAG: PD-(D/E)XK nuclease family protein [Deltaproteobacteria bacterium]|nr:PD-(D/E)XK nuclease family protein [Deltaproteobacteria bacterium]
MTSNQPQTQATSTITAWHPSGQYVSFDPGPHIYRMGAGSPMMSCTTFIKTFFPAFDREGVSARYAEKYDLDQATVLANWDAKGTAAATLGTKVHRYAECLMTGQTPLPRPADDIEAGYFESAALGVVHLLKKYEFIKSEMMIASPGLGLAGTIDLIMKQKKTFLILDWKTNAKINKSNQYQKGLPPIGHIDDCNYNHYRLQLNLYQYLLEKEKYFVDATGFRTGLIHLSPDGAMPEIMTIQDMTDAIENMINYFNDI